MHCKWVHTLKIAPFHVISNIKFVENKENNNYSFLILIFLLKMTKLFPPIFFFKKKTYFLYAEDEELKGKELEYEHLMEREGEGTLCAF